MRCIGHFENDRICDMCKHTNQEVHESCKELASLKRSPQKKTECRHSEYKWDRGTDSFGRDEDYRYLYCNRKKDVCNPDVECLNIIKIWND